MSKRVPVGYRGFTPREHYEYMVFNLPAYERETSYVCAAMEDFCGPRQWDATIATLAEAEDDDVEGGRRAEREPQYAMTLAEIGDHLGLSREAVRRIIECAFRKIRSHPDGKVLCEWIEAQ